MLLRVSVLSAALAAGCATLLPAPAVRPPAVIEAAPALAAGPNEPEPAVAPPQNGRNLIVGVYNCFDSTGQRKVTKAGQADFSNVVLQDCGPFLSAALRSFPQHYRVIERGRLDDVLKERQLAQAMYGEQTRTLIGNLLIADVLMLGQIVSYDRTVAQSAGGIAINAVGGSVEQVSDTLTFNLRAVSTKSGEVLNEVLVTKTVESLQANGHVLKIIGLDVTSLEFGAASNEPAGIALQQAVYLAVRTLTGKGSAAGWWVD
ncbi:hypothetical protein FJ250_13240 [bacterium]|nr:hypothetical protein [bacterium]MBM4199713.1 hypothetical protein [Gammaproteobacteria bacterium]